MPVPRLIWDIGTGYDLFVSLMVLHKPSKYGLRGAWAKGVRARLPAAERELLAQATGYLWPMGWVHGLPDPKNAATVLQALELIPPADRLPALMFSHKTPDELRQVLKSVAARRVWDEGDRAAVHAIYQSVKSASPKKEGLVDLLESWSRPQEFGECYLEALRTYCQVFFAEEETRIRPALGDALTRARELAGKLEFSALLEELSQGLRLAELPQVTELVLAPSFWSTPLLVFAPISTERELILFGARPPDASLVPGEIVPDAVMRALKALGDPTRLRILRYLMEEPLSPAQLARRLRLRAPTVIHHLDTLRMAELVHLTLEAGEKRRYAARSEAVKSTFAALEGFLKQGEHEGADKAG